MPKPPPKNYQLQIAFPVSLKLARRVTQREHRTNPLLNILNMTAKSATQYPDLTGEKGISWRLANSVIGACGTIIRALIHWHKSIRQKNSAIHADFIIISHLTTPSHLANSNDFYFGDLDKDLEKAGYKTHTILINHCRATLTDVQKNIRQKTTVLPAFLSPWQEIKALIRMIAAARTIPRLDEQPAFRRNAQCAQFCSKALSDYRIGNMVSRIIKKSHPQAVMHTYEGHGWERLIQTDCHNMEKPPIVIGYQHAVLFPGLKSINYRHGHGADPDHIFSAGKITYDQLINESEFDRISILGSPKISKNPGKAKFEANGTCLIAPEGTISEVMIMAKFAIDAAYLNPDQKFILRLHPVLKRTYVIRKIRKFSPLPNNFSLSTADINSDFNAASWLCYRGSTMAVQGILNGLRPIYLDPDNTAASNDPIPASLAFRRVARNERELVDIIKLDQKHDQLANKEFISARRFALEYLLPINPEILNHYLKSKLS